MSLTSLYFSLWLTDTVLAEDCYGLSGSCDTISLSVGLRLEPFFEGVRRPGNQTGNLHIFWRKPVADS